MPTREQGRVDSGRRELGARVQNYHVPSTDREGDIASSSNTPASISLTISLPPPVTLAIGATYQSTATVYNTVGNVIPGAQPTGWQSSSPSIATVDGNGLIIGVSAGTANITATLNAITSNPLAITVVVVPDTAAASVTISPTTLTVQRNAPQTLSAVIRNAGGVALPLSPTSWTSGDPTKATVSSTGVVTWVAAGTTNVTANYNTLISNVCVVTTPAVVDTVAASVAVSPTTLSLVTGAPQTLSAVVKNAAGTALAVSPTSWTSSDPTKATVNSSGVVTWVAAGSTSVTAHYNAITSNACAVTALVDANTVAASVTVTPTTLSLQTGAPQTLSAVVKNSSGVALALTPTSWTSSNTGVATVNGSGVVTWVAVGTTNVAAHYNALDSNNCVVTALVNPATVATSVTVSPTTLTLQSGAPQQLSAVIKNVSGVALPLTPTSWTSSAPSKATVSSSGLVTWVAAGTTNVAAHYNAIDSNNCAVTAVATTDTTPASILITPSSVTLEEGRTQQLTARVLNAAGDTLAGLSPSGWSSATPATCTVSATGLVTGVAAGGPINVTATYLALTSNACAVTVSAAAATDATLPLVFLDTDVADTPSNGSTIVTTTPTNLQAALNAAVLGNVVTLAAGTVYTGEFTYGVKTTGTPGEWVTVKTAGSLPAEHTRMTEALASSNSLPTIRMAGFSPGLKSVGAANNWRFVGIIFDVAPSVTDCGGLVLVGDASEAQNNISQVPTDIIFERCVFRGHAALAARKGITMDGARIAVIDSTIVGIHSQFDAQAITATNGPGPLKIVNNYLEGAAENIAFGGGDPHIAGQIPSDIEIRGNHIKKDLATRGVWLEKEAIESKNSTRVLVEGNVVENTWRDGQEGWCVGLYSVNQDGTAPWSETSHWTIQKNVFRNVSSGFSFTAKFSTPSPKAHHITCRDNVIIGLANPGVGGSGTGFSLWDIDSLTLENNTLISAGDGSAFNWNIEPPPSNLTVNQIIRNNIVGGGSWYTLSSGYGQGLTAWNLVHGAGSTFAGNVILSPTYPGLGGYIPANYYVTSATEIGFVGGAGAATSVTATLADLTISASSPHHNGGTDGSDCGADMAAIATAVSGVGGGF